MPIEVVHCSFPVSFNPESSIDTMPWIGGFLDVCNIIVEYNGFDPASNSTATDWDPIRRICSKPCSISRIFNISPSRNGNALCQGKCGKSGRYIIASIRPICKLNCNCPVARDCCGIPTLDVTKPWDSNELFNWVDNPLISSIDNLRLIYGFISFLRNENVWGTSSNISWPFDW